MDDNSKFQLEGLKWLFEMQLLNHPQLINNLKMNIFMVSPRIKEAELLISTDRKQMLVYLELSWLGRKFSKKSIFQETEEVLSQLLPSFKFRITDDPKIFSMSVEKVQKALSGGKNEKVSSDSNKLVDASSVSLQTPSVTATESATSVPSVETDIKKQP